RAAEFMADQHVGQVRLVVQQRIVEVGIQGAWDAEDVPNALFDERARDDLATGHGRFPPTPSRASPGFPRRRGESGGAANWHVVAHYDREPGGWPSGATEGCGKNRDGEQRIARPVAVGRSSGRGEGAERRVAP